MGLIPGAAALLVGEPVDDLSDTPSRWSVDDRTDDGGRDYCCGRDSRGGCDRMVTAAVTLLLMLILNLIFIVKLTFRFTLVF